MSDLSQSIQGILSDPSAMERIKSMMGEMGASPSGAFPEDEPVTAPPMPLASGGSDPLLSGMMRMQEVYSRANKEPDPRLALLSALRPYLSAHRAQEAESAMRILRLSRLLNVAKETNLLGNLI